MGFAHAGKHNTVDDDRAFENRKHRSYLGIEVDDVIEIAEKIKI